MVRKLASSRTGSPAGAWGRMGLAPISRHSVVRSVTMCASPLGLTSSHQRPRPFLPRRSNGAVAFALRTAEAREEPWRKRVFHLLRLEVEPHDDGFAPVDRELPRQAEFSRVAGHGIAVLEHPEQPPPAVVRFRIGLAS